MQNYKLWGARFNSNFDRDATYLSYSLHIDQRLALYDVKVNLAHIKALYKAKILNATEYKELEQSLKQLTKEFAKPNFAFTNNDEDIHSLIERLVIEKVGDLGKKMHTGKSRNDQVATDSRLFLKDNVKEIISQIFELQKVIFYLAEKNIDIIFPGFTHFQPAQPVLLSHHLLAYYEKLKRDLERFFESLKRIDVCPLGSGALSGNNYALDRKLIAKELGFAEISSNSMDAVSDREFILEFLANASICMSNLSRFSEELILWNNPMLGFVELDDAFTTGSSIMPQKKNPDIAELIRAKSGRLAGNFVGLLTVMKGLPLTYNRDMQEDKEFLFDTFDTLNLVLICFAKMLKKTKFNKKACTNALSKGYLNATELADYLVKKDIPFRTAHEITGKIVLHAISQQKPLEECTLKEFQTFTSKIEKDIYNVLNYETAINKKDIFGGTALKRVKEQLQIIKEQNKW